MNKKIAILIPCYNESITIGKVVTDFKNQLPSATIYVCDNNSSDNTANIAKEAGAIVFSETKQGKANAVLKLFSVVNADIYLMIDGDDTYPPEKAKTLINTLINEDLDMVVGDRLSNGTYDQENKRNFHGQGNRLVKKLINNLFNSSLVDVLSGYRVFSKRFIKNYSTLIKGFELETDLSIYALNYNFKIKEMPIEYKDRPEGSESKLNTFSDGFKVIKTIFNLYRFYKPLSFFTIIGAFFLLMSGVIGAFPIYEYFKFSYVYKVPSAVLAGFLAITAILLFICGLILDSIIKIDKKNTLLNIRNTK